MIIIINKQQRGERVSRERGEEIKERKCFFFVFLFCFVFFFFMERGKKIEKEPGLTWKKEMLGFSRANESLK